MKRRIFSMLLVVCMVFTLFPTAAFAAETGTPIGISSVTDSGASAVCEHTEHDDTCGYAKAVDGAPCSHLNEDGTYSCTPVLDSGVSGNDATPSDADKESVCDHNDDCGYVKAVDGTDCTHECERCKEIADAGSCVCNVLCTEDKMNADCPVCGAENADLAACKPAEEITPPAVKDCDCTVKCTLADEENGIEESINADCPVCSVDGAELSECKGEAATLFGVMPLAVDTANGATITTALDFTTNSGNSDCTSYTGINHVHSDEADKCFTWDSNTNTLTINNLNLETTAVVAINLPADATVNMGGKNSNSTVKSGKNTAGGSKGIKADGNLTFNGTGALTVSSGTATDTSMGVYAGNITVSGTGTLNATSGQAKYSFGASGTITVSDAATLEAKSTSTSTDTGSIAQAVGSVPVAGNGASLTVTGSKTVGDASLTEVTDLSDSNVAEYKHLKFVATPAAGVTEQFNLANGGTYYFDLSAEKANIGTINTAVPDKTLHYVPFTYAGTVNAYSLTSASAPDDTWANSSKSDRSLFVADYNVSHSKSWNDLNTADLIFGKTFDTTYTLRSLSAGSSTANNIVSPSTNEWDQILDKNSDYIKNWSNIYSWGQDTDASNSEYRTLRGSSSAANWSNGSATRNSSNYGWRPALEVLNTGTLGTDGLKSVTLNLNGGSLGSADSINIICAGDSFKAPSGEGLTPPTGKVFDKWTTTVTGGSDYGAGASVPSTVTTLTAAWKDATTNVAEIDGTGYATLQAAVNAVTEGQTIKLLKDTTVDSAITIASDRPSFTLDLNGKKLTGSSGGPITHSGSQTLTITDRGINGEINGYGTGDVGIRNSSTGTVKILGGKIVGNSYGICNDSTGTVNIEVAAGKTALVMGWNGAINQAPTLTNTTAKTSGTYDDANPTGEYVAGSIASYKTIKFEASTSTKITTPLDFSNVTSNVDCTMAVANGGSGHTHADGGKCWEWAYNAAGSTLKLNNVDIEVATTSGSILGSIKLPNTATTISFSGKNRVISTEGAALLYAISSQSGSITLTGAADAELTASGRNIGVDTMNGTVTITGGTVNTFGKNVAGISGRLGVTISGGTVTATTDSTNIYCAAIWSSDSGHITLTGSKVTATAGAGAKPFMQEPALTDMVHDETSGAWNNTAGTPCAYKPGTPSTDHTITFDANGGSVSPTTVTTVSGKLTSLPIPTRSGSYRFDGWFTAASGGTRVTTETVFDADTTIYAHWAYTGGGSSGGDNNDDDSNITVTTPPADKPNTPTEGEIKLDGKVDNNGNASVSITDKNINDAYNKALADAKKNGNEANGITLVLNVNTGNQTANSLTVNLPKTVQDTIISNKIVNTVVVVDNPDIKIGMDLATVKEINKQAKADVSITATKADSSKLTGSAKTAIGSRPVFDLAVNYGSGKQVTGFGAGSVSVSIPYTLGAKEKAGNVQAVYVDGNGKVQWLTSSVYDSVNKVLRFSTNHFSTYGVGYKADAPVLTDIDSHWAKDDIQFVVNRGLLAGTSATAFSPNTAMSRGMFVTALGRLANADVSSYKKSSFPDVKADSYYMGYIEWASKNGIVSGGSDGKFNPDASITREQMAVIMSNYAKAIGFVTPKAHAENAFADSAKISTYAKAAVKQMQMAGVLMGKNGNSFDPQGIATRAEASAILRRFVELVISSDTMQGWTMNDSGQWMYYENGKPVTGKKDIDGAAYTFNQYGVTADMPKNLRYTTYTVQKDDSFWLIAYRQDCTISELERLNNKSRFDIIYAGEVLRVPEQ